MNTNDEATKNLMNMTADSIGRDLLGALVQEVKLLPDPWVKTPKAKQDDVIERLRSRVDVGVRMAVRLLASENRATISATVDQVTIKDGIKAVLTLGKNDPNRHALCDAQGLSVLIIVANPDDHIGGMDEIKGESDQRAMDLGHEYNKKAEDKGIDDAKKKAAETATDAVLKLVGKAVEQQDLDEHYKAGRLARRAGKAKEQAPLVALELVARWTQGWVDEDAEFDADSNTPNTKPQASPETGDAAAAAKPGPRPGTRVPIKFRNPATGETWTGRGLKPQWITRALAEGKELEDFAVSPSSDAGTGLSAD